MDQEAVDDLRADVRHRRHRQRRRSRREPRPKCPREGGRLAAAAPRRPPRQEVGSRGATNHLSEQHRRPWSRGSRGRSGGWAGSSTRTLRSAMSEPTLCPPAPPPCQLPIHRPPLHRLRALRASAAPPPPPNQSHLRQQPASQQHPLLRLRSHLLCAPNSLLVGIARRCQRGRDRPHELPPSLCLKTNSSRNKYTK